VIYIAKRPARWRGVFLNFYLAGDSSFDAAPAGPVVVFGIEFGAPFAPPVVVIAEPPPELMPEDDVPVVVDFFTASEFEFVIPGLFMVSVCAAGPVFCA
jgi:hypothetical protein